ncbi:MFS transporter [Microbulbifer taiwanensis]|uniref:MFS transporter n=1 Tax=Microbulbifer taiwanensis TaxID=986746 RepID=UPI0036163048
MGVFSQTMNGTAMITAVPPIRHDFDLSPTMLQWVVTIYFLVGAIFLAAAGRMGDRFGLGRVFLAGTLCFVAAYIIMALAADGLTMLVGRGLQGLAGGLLLPMSLALVRATFPEQKRQFGAAIWSGVLGLGLGIGPIVGGLLTHYLSWRYIFWFSMAIVVAAFIIVAIALRGRLSPPKRGQPEFQDFTGFLLIATAMATFTFALTHAQDLGWHSGTTISTLLASIVATIALLLRERSASMPFLNLDFFRNRDFIAASLGIFSAFFLIYVILVFASIFTQNILAFDYTPALAGFSLLSLTLLMFLLSTVVHRVAARYGYQVVVTTGMLLLMIGATLLHVEATGNGVLGFETALAVCGLGLGLTLPVFSGLGVQTLPPDQTGQGSGVLTTFTFLGATVGVSIGGLVSANGARSSLDGSLSALDLPPAEVANLTAGLHATEQKLSMLLSRYDAATAETIREALIQAVYSGFADLTLLCAVLAALGALAQFRLLRAHSS